MLKFELIKRLEQFPDDAPVIFMEGDGGWTNIDVIASGCDIAIVPDYVLPFSDE